MQYPQKIPRGYKFNPNDLKLAMYPAPAYKLCQAMYEKGYYPFRRNDVDRYGRLVGGMLQLGRRFIRTYSIHWLHGISGESWPSVTMHKGRRS